MSLSIYYGKEEWILRGLGQDLKTAFQALYPHFAVGSVDAFEDQAGQTRHHFFVQQGQLGGFIRRTKSTHILPNSVCLFTHFDKKQFPVEVLNRCKSVMFMSSSQLPVAVANGLDANKAFIMPIGVDQKLHQIYSEKIIAKIQKNNELFSSIGDKKAVGFCLRYWDKDTYINRKRYGLVNQVVEIITACNIPVIILGPGWKKCEDRVRNNLVTYVDTKYQNYPYVYNLMKVFCSLSLHEGGPVPLLESMSCGVKPVVTNTGYAFDILGGRDFTRDYLLPIDAEVHEIVAKILSAYVEDSRQTVYREIASKFSFEESAKKLYGIFNSSS